MRKAFRIILLMLLLLAGSCDVHELPDGENYVRMTFHLLYDEEMPPYKDLTFDSKSFSQSPELPPSYAMRTVLKVYEGEPGGTWSTVPYWKTEIIDDDYSSLDREISVMLPPKRFRAFVWSDFVRTDGSDNFFSLDGFPEVRQSSSLNTGGDFKSSFYAVDIARMDEIMELNASVTHDVEMIRPSAKILFFASDLDDYIAELRKRAAAISGPESITPQSINIESYSLKVTYLGFLPDTWNIREGFASDSSTGHTYLGHAKMNEDGTLAFGSDYVLSGVESSVDIMLEIFDSAGKLITRLNQLTIPISKGKTTTVTGRMMTHGVSGSVVIDPEYDGEFNIYI